MLKECDLLGVSHWVGTWVGPTAQMAGSEDVEESVTASHGPMGLGGSQAGARLAVTGVVRSMGVASAWLVRAMAGAGAAAAARVVVSGTEEGNACAVGARGPDSAVAPPATPTAPRGVALRCSTSNRLGRRGVVTVASALS